MGTKYARTTSGLTWNIASHWSDTSPGGPASSQAPQPGDEVYCSRSLGGDTGLSIPAGVSASPSYINFTDTATAGVSRWIPNGSFLVNGDVTLEIGRIDTVQFQLAWSGVGNVTKVGPGSFYFYQGFPNFQGDFIIREGWMGGIGSTWSSSNTRLVIGDPNVEPTYGIGIGQGGSLGAFNINVPVQINRDVTFGSQVQNIYFNGRMEINPGITIHTYGDDIRFYGPITGSGVVAKIGAYALRLNDNNINWSGSMHCISGTVAIEGSASLASKILNIVSGWSNNYSSSVQNYYIGGLEGDGIYNTSKAFYIGHYDWQYPEQNFYGEIRGNHTFTKIGDNTQIFSWPNSARSASVVVSEGILEIQDPEALGQARVKISASNLSTYSPPIFKLNNMVTFPYIIDAFNSASLESAGTCYIGNTLNLTGSGEVYLQSYDGRLVIQAPMSGGVGVNLRSRGYGEVEYASDSSGSYQTFIVEEGTTIFSGIDFSNSILKNIGSGSITFGDYYLRVDFLKYDDMAPNNKIYLNSVSGYPVDFHTYEDSDIRAETFNGDGVYWKHGSGTLDLRNQTTTNLIQVSGTLIANNTTNFQGIVAVEAYFNTPGKTKVIFPYGLVFDGKPTMTFG